MSQKRKVKTTFSLNSVVRLLDKLLKSGDFCDIATDELLSELKTFYEGLSLLHEYQVATEHCSFTERVAWLNLKPTMVLAELVQVVMVDKYQEFLGRMNDNVMIETELFAIMMQLEKLYPELWDKTKTYLATAGFRPTVAIGDKLKSNYQHLATLTKMPSDNDSGTDIWQQDGRVYGIEFGGLKLIDKISGQEHIFHRADVHAYAFGYNPSVK